MIAIKKSYRGILGFLVTLFLFSCSSATNKEEENIYQILNLLTNVISEELIIHPSFPTPPDGVKYNFTTKDSLEIYKYFYEQYSNKKIIAFEKKMLSDGKIGSKADSLIYKSNTLISKLNEININKITLIKKDTLIYYTTKYNKKLGDGFNDIDFLLSFSEITFNKSFTKAYLTVNIRFEKLDSLSTFIYLEKNGYNWQIKFEKTLSIS